MPDSLYHKLQHIEACLDSLVANTGPINEIHQYSQVWDGRVAILALVVSLIATVFGFLGYIYQKRSAVQLEKSNQRRPNLYPIVEKLYNNYILLQIIYEKDSNYDMSFTAEMKIPYEERSSAKLNYINCIQSPDAILNSLVLPERIILLQKYEIYGDDEIYNLAFTIRNNISEYNRRIDIACANLKSRNEESYKYDSEDLYSVTRILLRNLLLLDSLCLKKRSLVRKDDNSVQHELAHFIVSRFFSSLHSFTPDNVVADPYRAALVHPIDFTDTITLSDMRKKKTKIDAIRVKGNQYNSEKLIYTYINSAMNCITQISNRKDKTEQKPLGFIDDIFGKFKKKELVRRFDDKVFKEKVECCFGDIYGKIREQVDNEVFDLNYIAWFDILMHLAVQKHNYLLNGTKHEYNKEMRRIEKKKMWNNDKKKYTK